MRRMNQGKSALGAGLSVLMLSVPAWAVPYASAIRNSSGSTYEFVLNESADTVTIERDGGNPLVFNAPAAGRYTFDMTGFSNFDIKVAKDVPQAWTEISQRSNLFTHFFRPNGLAVNKDPSSPYFGTVYVSHPISTFTGDQYGFGQRTAGDGIYSLTADLIGVDLANNFAVVTDVNDTTQAKAVGFTVGSNSSSSPWRIALDDGGNVIIADWSDQSGGIKYMSPDLSTGGLVLDLEDGGPSGFPLLVNSENEEIHGSIFSKPIVSGTVGVDLVVSAIDEDFDLDYDTFTDPDGPGPIPASQYFNSVWRWNVGSATAYDQPPELVVSSQALNTGETKWYSTIKSVAVDAHYEPQFNKWYLTQSRTHGNQSSLVIVTANEDGTMPDIDWSSREWSLANNLDGAIPNPATPVDTLPEVEGLQDIFRSIGSVTISADGKYMYLHRAQQFNSDSLDGDNPYLGGNSAYPGGILVVPLDENGLPVISLNDNGTPGDTSDDTITNFQSISYEDELFRHVRHPIEQDAAGNVYISNNISEIMQVFSPGGNTLAITSSDGTFSLNNIGSALVGDYNGDGTVDAADYTVWRDNLGADGSTLGDGRDPANSGVVGPGDYASWKANFGSSGGSGALGGGTVPEPTAGLLCLLGIAGAASLRCRRITGTAT